MVFKTMTQYLVQKEYERFAISDPKESLEFSIKSYDSIINSKEIRDLLLPAEFNKEEKIDKYKTFYQNSISFLIEPEIEFNDEQSNSFIRLTNRPNKNKEKLKNLTEKLLSGVDVFSDEIEWDINKK